MLDRIYLCGGTSAFRQFLTQLAGDRVMVFGSPEIMPAYEAGSTSLYVILPQYEQGESLVNPMDMELVMRFGEYKKNGASIYIENYPSRDYLTLNVFGFFMTGRQRYVYQENVTANGMLLQAGNSFYFPQSMSYGPKVKVLANIGDSVGLHQESKSATFQFPVLTDDSAGCIGATMNFSEFDPLFMRPYREWKIFFASLWGRLLNVNECEIAAAFEQVWPKIIDLTGDQNTETALQAALNWHLESGLLYAPDGSHGAYEMIRSDDLEFRKNLRTDCILMTGALLAGAGKCYHREDWLQTGKHLADFILDRHIQTEDGFIRWYDNLTRVYSNDLGRHGLSLLYLWEMTGEERYHQVALHLEKAALNWLSKDGICCGSFDIHDGYTECSGSPSPVFHGEMAAFLLKMKTADGKEAVRKILNKIDLDSQDIGHSRPDVWSRALLLYCCAHGTVQDCSSEISKLLDYYEKLQTPCGGLREDDLFIRQNAPLEAGVAQGGGHDSIADILYCNNYVFAALSIIRKKNADPRVEEIYQKLKTFLLHIQIKSQDCRFNGAWMRAFDMEYNEYYGLLLDRDWGPYCIMSGWVMGMIPLVLLDELHSISFFEPLLEFVGKPQ